MRITCLTLALPFTTGRFHGCILILKTNHLFPLPRTLAWFLIWGGFFFKIYKLIVFNIWFLSLLLNLRQFDLKKRNSCLPIKYVYYLIYVLLTQASPCFTWCGFYNNWRPGICDEYTTHISETQIWLCLIFTNNSFPLQSVEVDHTKKEKRTSWQQLHAQENKILVVCAVGPLRNKTTTREKVKKNLCDQGVNCRCSVPNKKENRRHNPKCFLHTHTHTLTHSLSLSLKILICWKVFQQDHSL